MRTSMLTLCQVVRVCEAGVEVKLVSGCGVSLCGEYDPGLKEVIIYRKNIFSEDDFRVTLLHEFIHARDDVYGWCDPSEDVVEAEAERTLRERRYVCEVLLELYGLRA